MDETTEKLAREAGLWTLDVDALQRFAALVRADERAKCTRLADEQWVRDPRISGGDALRNGEATNG